MSLDQLIYNEQKAMAEKRNPGSTGAPATTETTTAATTTTTVAPATTETTTAAPATTTTTAAPATTTPKTEVPKYDPVWLKETLGTDNVDEIKTKLSGQAQLEQQWQAAETKVKELEARTPVAPYKGGDLSAMVDQAIANGVPLQTIARIAPLNDATLEQMGKTPDGQAMIVKEHMAIQKPHLTPKQIDALFNKEFAIVDDTNEDEVTLKGAALADKFQEARTSLKEYTGKTFVAPDPGKAEADRKANVEALDKSWQPHLSAISNAVKTVSSEIVIPKFGNPTESVKSNFAFELTPDMQKDVMAITHRQLLTDGINPDDAGRKMVEDYARNIARIKYGDVIEKAKIEFALSEQLKQFNEEIHNPNIQRNLARGGEKGKDGLTATERQVLGIKP